MPFSLCFSLATDPESATTRLRHEDRAEANLLRPRPGQPRLTFSPESTRQTARLPRQHRRYHRARSERRLERWEHHPACDLYSIRPLTGPRIFALCPDYVAESRSPAGFFPDVDHTVGLLFYVLTATVATLRHSVAVTLVTARRLLLAVGSSLVVASLGDGPRHRPRHDRAPRGPLARSAVLTCFRVAAAARVASP